MAANHGKGKQNHRYQYGVGGVVVVQIYGYILRPVLDSVCTIAAHPAPHMMLLNCTQIILDPYNDLNSGGQTSRGLGVVVVKAPFTSHFAAPSPISIWIL